MKKAKVTITFNVCDDFEAGKCPICPYQTRTYFENHYISETVKCLLGYTNVTCPIEILEKGGADMRQEGEKE